MLSGRGTGTLHQALTLVRQRCSKQLAASLTAEVPRAPGKGLNACQRSMGRLPLTWFLPPFPATKLHLQEANHTLNNSWMSEQATAVGDVLGERRRNSWFIQEQREGKAMVGVRAMGWEEAGGGTGVEEVESKGRCPGMRTCCLL